MASTVSVIKTECTFISLELIPGLQHMQLIEQDAKGKHIALLPFFDVK